MSYKKVELPELNDCIHYGQTKIYSESQYSRSDTLAREIKAGRVLLMERRQEDDASFKAPEQAIVREVRVPEPPQIVEKVVIPEVAPDVSLQSTLAGMTEQISLLAKKVEETIQPAAHREPAPKQDTQTAIALQEIARKIDSLQVSGPGVVQNRAQGIDFKEEVYIPDIVVTDMANHINLKGRDIGHGGQVNESLAALKKLKNRDNR